MTPKRKPLSALARLTASHMRLLKVQRGLITEIGLLRKLLLEMRGAVQTPDWYPKYYTDERGLRLPNVPYSTEEYDVPPDPPPYDWPRL